MLHAEKTQKILGGVDKLDEILVHNLENLVDSINEFNIAIWFVRSKASLIIEHNQSFGFISLNYQGSSCFQFVLMELIQIGFHELFNQN